MKLEYLADGSPDCPILRLYDFTPAEAGQLADAASALAAGAVKRVDLHLLPFVQAVGACRLALIRQTWDQAVVRGTEPNEFTCGYTPGTWENVVKLVEPFAAGAAEFQWLAGAPGQAALLLSTSGQW